MVFCCSHVFLRNAKTPISPNFFPSFFCFLLMCSPSKTTCSPSKTTTGVLLPRRQLSFYNHKTNQYFALQVNLFRFTNHYPRYKPCSALQTMFRVTNHVPRYKPCFALQTMFRVTNHVPRYKPCSALQTMFCGFAKPYSKLGGHILDDSLLRSWTTLYFLYLKEIITLSHSLPCI